MEVGIESEMHIDLRGKFPSMWTDLKETRLIFVHARCVHDVKFHPLCGMRGTGENLHLYRSEVNFK